MSLNEKVVVVFAGAGAIGAGFAKVAAEQGATVVVTAREREAAEAVTRSLAGKCHAREADALDPEAVGRVLDWCVEKLGGIDAVFNAIGGRPRDLGYPQRSTETSLTDFRLPFERIVGSQFLTAREAGRRMSAARPVAEDGHPRGGAIVLLSATLSRMTARHMAGITAACGAVESLTRGLAGDFGAHGIRVNCVRGSAMPETRTIRETGAGIVALGETPQMGSPPLGRPIRVRDTAEAVAFLASERASRITGQVLTVCAGAFV